jgi:hypothetical protein
MDAEKVEKINALAKSLRDKHLVANMEEGIEKAKQILGYKDEENPAEELKTVEELFAEEEKTAKLAEETKEDVEEIKEDIEEAEKDEKKDEKELEEVEKEIESDREKIEEIKEEVEEPEEE